MTTLRDSGRAQARSASSRSMAGDSSIVLLPARRVLWHDDDWTTASDSTSSTLSCSGSQEQQRRGADNDVPPLYGHVLSAHYEALTSRSHALDQEGDHHGGGARVGRVRQRAAERESLVGMYKSIQPMSHQLALVIGFSLLAPREQHDAEENVWGQGDDNELARATLGVLGVIALAVVLHLTTRLLTWQRKRRRQQQRVATSARTTTTTTSVNVAPLRPLFVLYLLAPALKTLAQDTASDSANALAVALFALNVACAPPPPTPRPAAARSSSMPGEAAQSSRECNQAEKAQPSGACDGPSGPDRLRAAAATAPTTSTRASRRASGGSTSPTMRATNTRATVSLAAALSGATVQASRVRSNALVFYALSLALVWFHGLGAVLSLLRQQQQQASDNDDDSETAGQKWRALVMLDLVIGAACSLAALTLSGPKTALLSALALFTLGLLVPAFRLWLVTSVRPR